MRQGLGREERVEGGRLRRRVHAGARVPHRHEDHQPAAHVQRARPLVVELAAADVDAERAAIGHGIAGVGREAEDGLLDLAGIGEDLGRLLGDGDRDLDLLAHQPRQHLGHLAEHHPDVDHLGLHDLPAAEGEELTGERRCTNGGVANLVEVETADVAVVELRIEQVAVAHHRRQQVVEVVRDAAGEPADGIEPLRLPDRLLELALVRGVPEAPQVGDDPASHLDRRVIPLERAPVGRGERLVRAGHEAGPPGGDARREPHGVLEGRERRRPRAGPRSFLQRPQQSGRIEQGQPRGVDHRDAAVGRLEAGGFLQVLDDGDERREGGGGGSGPHDGVQLVHAHCRDRRSTRVSRVSCSRTLITTRTATPRNVRPVVA